MQTGAFVAIGVLGAVSYLGLGGHVYALSRLLYKAIPREDRIFVGSHT